MTIDELRSAIENGAYVVCKNPAETGAVLGFLRDVMGYWLVIHDYVTAIANDPESYVDYDETYHKFLHPHKTNWGENIITISLSPNKDRGGNIPFEDLEALIETDRFDPASDEELSSLFFT